MSDPYAEFSSPVGAGSDPYAEFAMPVSKSKAKPNQQEAVKALSEASAQLDKQLAGLPEEARRIGRQKFNADPRIKDLVAQVNAGLPKEEPTTLSQLGTSFKQRGAALVKGLASIPDAATEAVAGAMRLSVKPTDIIGTAALDALGFDDAAAKFHQFNQNLDRGLSQPFTVRRGVEKVVTPDQTTSGKIADFATEMLGGAAVPQAPVNAAISRVAGVSESVPLSTLATAAPKAATTPAAEIVEEGTKRGVRVLTSDVKPPKTFMGKMAQSIGEKIPFAGTGGVRASQQAERVEAVKSALREFGGDDAVQLFDDAPGAVEQVAADLIKRRGTQLEKLTGAKNRIIDGTEGVVPVDRTVTAIDDAIANLKSKKLPELNAVITKLEGWKEAIQGQNLRNIEDIRKAMGEAFNDPGLAGVKTIGQKALNKIYDPMRAEMGTFIRSRAGKQAFDTWTRSNRELASMAGELKAGGLKRVLTDAEATPENVGKLLFSAKPSEVARLYNNLSPAGQAKARAAVVQRAFDKAISADGGLSVERFTNNLKSMGAPIGVLFKGADKESIAGLTRLLDATRRASAASVAPPTGVQNLPAAAGYSLGSLFGQAAIPVAGLGGLLARAYESAPVRNLLLRLAKTAPGSRNEQAIIRQLTPYLTAAAANNNEVGAVMGGKVSVPVAAGDGEEN